MVRVISIESCNAKIVSFNYKHAPQGKVLFFPWDKIVEIRKALPEKLPPEDLEELVNIWINDNSQIQLVRLPIILFTTVYQLGKTLGYIS